MTRHKLLNARVIFFHIRRITRIHTRARTRNTWHMHNAPHASEELDEKKRQEKKKNGTEQSAVHEPFVLYTSNITCHNTYSWQEQPAFEERDEGNSSSGVTFISTCTSCPDMCALQQSLLRKAQEGEFLTPTAMFTRTMSTNML